MMKIKSVDSVCKNEMDVRSFQKIECIHLFYLCVSNNNSKVASCLFHSCLYLTTQLSNDGTFHNMVTCHSPILDMDIPDSSEYNLLLVSGGAVPWLRWLIVGLSLRRIIATELCRGSGLLLVSYCRG